MPADLHVACATDEAYVPYCAAMLQALLRHHPRGLTVHLLHAADLAPDRLAVLRNLVESAGGRWHPLGTDPARVADLPRMARIPPVMWLRILLPDLLPDIDRLLYLDVDTLALEPIDSLWSTDLGANLIGAVDNVLHADQAHRPAALGLPAGSRYFNSGVLLMDLHGMRREGIVGKLIDCARTRETELLWPDQDALNIVLGAQRMPLHARWNCQNSFFYWRPRSIETLGLSMLDEALTAPAIVHFEGPSWAKPWHFLSDHPWRPEWRAVQRSTGFPLPQPETWVKRVIGQLPPSVVGLLRRALGYPQPQGPSSR